MAKNTVPVEVTDELGWAFAVSAYVVLWDELKREPTTDELLSLTEGDRAAWKTLKPLVRAAAIKLRREVADERT